MSLLIERNEKVIQLWTSCATHNPMLRTVPRIWASIFHSAVQYCDAFGRNKSHCGSLSHSLIYNKWFFEMGSESEMGSITAQKSWEEWRKSLHWESGVFPRSPQQYCTAQCSTVQCSAVHHVPSTSSPLHASLSDT